MFNVQKVQFFKPFVPMEFWSSFLAPGCQSYCLILGQQQTLGANNREIPGLTASQAVWRVWCGSFETTLLQDLS